MFANTQIRRSKSTMIAALHAALRATPVLAKLAARNTLDYTDATGTRRIRLHDTDILTFPPGGGFVIDTGGWGTVTTRARLREFLPPGFSVYCAKGRLHLNGIPFLSRVTVGPDGAIKTDLPPAADDKLVKSINAYMAAWRKRGLPTAADSGGDPWILTAGKVDRSIMADWIKSRYVFRKLYAMALQYAGITDYGVTMYLRSADHDGLDKTALRRIRRYVRACMGMVA